MLAPVLRQRGTETVATRKPAAPKSQSDKIREAQAPAPQPARKDDGRPTNNLVAAREAEERGLHKLLADLRPLISDVDAASAIVKTKRDAVSKRLDQGAADGYPKGMVRKMLKETAVTGERKNQREEWELEVRWRQWLGLPATTQPDLEDRTPSAARDEQDWLGDGYASGLRGDACDPKARGVPDRLHQPWMAAWGEGQTKLALSLGKPPRSGPILGVVEGGKDLGGEMLNAIAEVEPEIVAQAQADHGEDTSEEDAEAEAMAERLEGTAANSEPI